jgi:hypothetical protein
MNCLCGSCHVNEVGENYELVSREEFNKCLSVMNYTVLHFKGGMEYFAVSHKSIRFAIAYDQIKPQKYYLRKYLSES